MSVLVPRSSGSKIYLLLLLGVAVGLVLIIFGQWRPGIAVIGTAFVVGAGARAVVPQRHVGMLRVRGKVFDIGWMSLLGVSLILLSIVVPAGPQ